MRGKTKLEGNLARLAAYGAYLVVVGLIVLLASLVVLTWPVSTGGMNWAMSAVLWIPLFVLLVALAGVHIALAHQLLEAATRQSA